jgi:PleD family two-component response regulator
MRGDDAELRAERRRQAIPAAVANAVSGLGHPVTASMGMTDVPIGADIGFAELYRQADKLLYEAKLSGRNRTKATSVEAEEDDLNPLSGDARACR